MSKKSNGEGSICYEVDRKMYRARITDPHGKRLSQRFKTKKEAQLEHKNFYVLRHTHATQLLANHVPLIEVSRRLGHSKPSITLDLYGHAIPGYDKQIPSKVEAIFGLNGGHSLVTTQGKK